jgi:hypothetical protein
MARSTFSILLCIFVTVVPVLAGNRAWEPKIRDAAPVISVRDPGLLTGSNNASFKSSQSASPQKRWVAIKPGPGNADAKLWPNKEITYCFEDADSLAALFDDLLQAEQLWHDQGLSKNFKWTQGSATFCENSDNRSKFLLISYNTEGKLATTVGLPPLQEGTTAGPTMKLSDSLDVGHLNVVPNYAHVSTNILPSFWDYLTLWGV